MERVNPVFEQEDIKISPRIKFANLRNTLISIGKHLSKLLGSKRIGIYLKGRESGNWALALTRQLDDIIIERAKIINHTCSEELYQSIDTRQPCLLEEVLESEDAESVRGENLIVAPMWHEDEVMGLLLADFDVFANLSDRDLIQLNLAAHVIKSSIEREFLSIQVAEMEKTRTKGFDGDAASYFHNNQLLEWLLEREIERTLRHGSTFAVLMMALDNLPHLISQYHPNVSNMVVAECFEAMNHILRKCDLLTRRGGHQFVCLSMQQNEAGAHVLASKFRHKIKEIEFHVGKDVVKTTLSAGVAIWPQGPRIPASKLIRRAEVTLEEALKIGNRVLTWRNIQSEDQI